MQPKLGIPAQRPLQYLIMDGSDVAACKHIRTLFLQRFNREPSLIRLPASVYVGVLHELGLSFAFVTANTLEINGVKVKPWPVVEGPEFPPVALRYEDER